MKPIIEMDIHSIGSVPGDIKTLYFDKTVSTTNAQNDEALHLLQMSQKCFYNETMSYFVNPKI